MELGPGFGSFLLSVLLLGLLTSLGAPAAYLFAALIGLGVSGLGCAVRRNKHSKLARLL